MTSSFPAHATVPLSLRSPVARMLIDHNPFYLLSAACMLFGVFALNGSLDYSPIGVRKLLTMIVMLNVYEAIIIALAVFLLRRGIRRDALLLLIVEAFFLADVGFLNMEIFATHAAVGLLVNVLLLAAAAVKVGFIFRAAGIPLADPRMAFVMIQVAVLFAVPGLFASIARRHDDFLSPLVIYCGWWLAGALPVAYTMTVGSLDVFRRRSDGRAPGADVILSRVLLVLPMLSLIVHLCLANWVYKVTFHPLNAAPLLLGLAVLCGHADQHVTTLASRLRLHLALPMVAVALSALRFPPEMVIEVGPLSISPLRLTLLVATLVYLDGLWLHRHVYFAWAAGASLGMAGMGHSVGTIHHNSVQMARTSASTFDRLVPDTLAEWGVVSITAAFLLLAIGATISLTRRPPVVVEEAPLEAEA
ncbi:MAG TPA: hypothetical protein VER17_09470 [Tepidisphaeraceae bacterium]|nr:hypothetical protein [Tepidisphaeraceae bacterium]